MCMLVYVYVGVYKTSCVQDLVPYHVQDCVQDQPTPPDDASHDALSVSESDIDVANTLVSLKRAAERE